MKTKIWNVIWKDGKGTTIEHESQSSHIPWSWITMGIIQKDKVVNKRTIYNKLNK